MTNYFLIYDDCCFYEIVLLGYFLKYSEREEQKISYCAADDREIRTTEGFLVKPDITLNRIPVEEVQSFVIPGGAIENVSGDSLAGFLSRLNRNTTYLGAICAGVTLLEQYGFLKGKNSIRTSDGLAVRDGRLITARPNGYVDFAIEMGKALKIFKDEDSLDETIDFFKYHKTME